MNVLLNHNFAPVTFTIGFVECPFVRFSQVFSEWQKQIDSEFGTQTEIRRFSVTLPVALLALEPLTNPLDRYLLIETRSDWCAIFANGLRGNDVFAPVSYLPTLLKCRGLETSYVPDRSHSRAKDALRTFGSVAFSLYGSEKTDWLNLIRHVAVTNDASGWEFSQDGEVQAFEKPENYRKRKVVDRFTVEMLESYCAALGIELFNESFYGGQCLLSCVGNRTAPPGLAMSISEARAHLYL